jgi:hypothetical protein
MKRTTASIREVFKFIVIQSKCHLIKTRASRDHRMRVNAAATALAVRHPRASDRLLRLQAPRG